MRVGDAVKSKNLSGVLKIPGRVTSITSASRVSSEWSKMGYDMTPWDIKLPNWRHGNVVMVEFPGPQKSCTLEEWVAQAMRKGQAREHAEAEYETKCPKTTVLAFPEDDLEVV